MSKLKLTEQACCICTELKSGHFCNEYQTRYGQPERICLENAEFVAMPSISPLVVGHMLIFPRIHISSLLQSLSFNALEKMTVAVADRLRRPGHVPYFFEHGVPNDAVGACGITHAHLHIVSLPQGIIDSVTRRVRSHFPKAIQGSVADIVKAGDLRKSYLIYGTQLNHLRFSSSDEIPSQYMRKLIATELGRRKWDWKLLDGIQRFSATLRLFDLEKLVSA